MAKSFSKLVEDKKQVHFRVLEVDGKWIKRNYFGGKFTDVDLEEDYFLMESLLGFDDLPH